MRDTCPCGSWLHKDTWLAGQERSVTSAGPPQPLPWPPATGLSQAVPLPCSGEALDVHPDLPYASKTPSQTSASCTAPSPSMHRALKRSGLTLQVLGTRAVLGAGAQGRDSESFCGS